MSRLTGRRLAAAALLLPLLAAVPASGAPRRPPARRTRPAAPARVSPGERISVDLKDADIRDVLRSFAEIAGVNLVVDPEVKGTVTVSLHDVFWVDALDVILRSNGLGMVAEGRVLRVGTPARLSGDDVR